MAKTSDERVPDHEQRMTLMEHLAELRNRLVKVVLAVAAGGIVAFLAYEWMLDLLVDPYCEAVGEDQDCQLVFLDPLEGFRTRFTLAGYGGIALAMPVILWQLWRFIAPGLYPQERRYALPFILSSVLLFVLGGTLAFFTIPRALEFLLEIGGSDLTPLFRPKEYVGFVTFMMLAFGIGFEFPILLVFMQLLGVIDYKQLAGFRRYAIVLIVVIVAVITPSGDPISLLSLAVPMYFFYEGSILVGRLLLRRKRRREAVAG